MKTARQPVGAARPMREMMKPAVAITLALDSFSSSGIHGSMMKRCAGDPSPLELLRTLFAKRAMVWDEDKYIDAFGESLVEESEGIPGKDIDLRLVMMRVAPKIGVTEEEMRSIVYGGDS